ncbi:MAG: LptE family protein [Thermoanaerobaculia bacterium]
MSRTPNWARALAFLSAALLVIVLAPGCGYGLVGAGRGSLPTTLKTVYVSTFVNETTRVGLEQRITDAVLREFSARARLKPVSDRTTADAELSGVLNSYQVDPVRFDRDGRALEYQISVVAKVTLMDRATDKPIFTNPAFLYRQPYTVPTSAGGYFEVETAAVEELARPFARSLVSTILEGF